MTQPNQHTPPRAGIDDPRHNRQAPAPGIEAHPELEPLPGPTEASNPREAPDLEELDELEAPGLVDPTVREPGPVNTQGKP
jgi:hypothetical protein